MPHLFTFLPVKMSLAVASSEKQRLALAGLTPHQAFVLIAAVGTACFVLWAALARLDVIVRTEGRIIPAGKSQIVQHLEGGLVHQVLVKAGDEVREGQALIKLAQVAAESSYKTIEDQLNAERVRLARAEAERLGAADLRLPKDILDG